MLINYANKHNQFARKNISGLNVGVVILPVAQVAYEGKMG